jgi:hypothetical protein
VTEAEAALKEAQADLAKYDLSAIKEKTSKADAEYRDAIYQSQLHSYTAMLFRKDPRDVSDGEVKTLEWYLIIIPSIAAALSSTLIAMTAVRRIKVLAPEPAATLSDEAMQFLFGPLVDAIRAEANAAVVVAIKTASPPTSGA